MADQAALQCEYEEVNKNIRALTDVRFKLIAYLPALGGIAALVLSMLGVLPTALAPANSWYGAWLVLAMSAFGFFASLALTVYDQRNSELYNALIHRAKHLEQLLGASRSPGSLRTSPYGGQYSERPPRAGRLFAIGRTTVVEVGHDPALALIYDIVLAVWFLPMGMSVLRIVALPPEVALPISAALALAMGLYFVGELRKRDAQERARWHEAARQDGLTR
jgi:hypothetical protein